MEINRYYLEIHPFYHTLGPGRRIRVVKAKRTPPRLTDETVIVEISDFLVDEVLVDEGVFAMCYDSLLAKTLRRLLGAKLKLSPWCIAGVGVEVSDYWEVWDGPEPS